MLSDLGEALNISHISEENGSLKISNDLIQFFTCRKTHFENMKKVLRKTYTAQVLPEFPEHIFLLLAPSGALVVIMV